MKDVFRFHKYSILVATHNWIENKAPGKFTFLEFLPTATHGLSALLSVLGEGRKHH